MHPTHCTEVVLQASVLDGIGAVGDGWQGVASTSLCPSWDVAEGPAPSTELWTCHLTTLSLLVIHKAGVLGVYHCVAHDHAG